MSEVWKDIEGYEGKYQVSNLGRVRSLPRTHDIIREKNGSFIYHRKEKMLAPRIDRYGYQHVNLYDNEQHMKRHPVHRLVAKAFIPNPEHLPTVNHKDENKQNNRADNLEWMSISENNNYGTRGQRIGMANARKRKAVVQLNMDGREVNRFVSLNEASRVTGISLGSIGKCANGENHSAGGYRWRYAE